MNEEKRLKISDFDSSSFTPYKEIWGVKLTIIEGVKKSVEIIDINTGESTQNEMLTSSRVNFKDRLEYVKLFRNSFDELMEMNTMGMKVLLYILKYLPKDTESITLNLDSVKDFAGYKNKKNVLDGIIELLDKGYISRKTGGDGSYWINPNKFFNGDRTKILDSVDRVDELSYLKKGKMFKP
jgi:hypothetical protein